MSSERYPIEVLDEDEDDGTIVENLATLGSHVIGHRITKAERQPREDGKQDVLVLTLDDGTQVELADTGDCCAYTSLDAFFLDPASVDHIITGAGSTDGYTVWHIYADVLLRRHSDDSCATSSGNTTPTTNPNRLALPCDAAPSPERQQPITATDSTSTWSLPPSSDDRLPVCLVVRTRPPAAATQPALPHPQPTPPDTRGGHNEPLTTRTARSPRHPHRAPGASTLAGLSGALAAIARATQHLSVLNRAGATTRERDHVIDLELGLRTTRHTRPTIPLEDELPFLLRPHPTATLHPPSRRTTALHSKAQQQRASHHRQANHPRPSGQIQHRQTDSETHHDRRPHRNSRRSDTCQSSPATSNCKPYPAA
jgi:hypothetical protein